MVRISILFVAACLSTVSGWTFENPRAAFQQVSSALGGVAVATTIAVAPVQAKGVNQGEQLFQADCAQCHSAIKSLPGDQTSLQKEALEKYRGGLDEGKIKSFVKDEFPHSFMPFALKYNDQDYSDVAKYVVEQAKK